MSIYGRWCIFTSSPFPDTPNTFDRKTHLVLIYLSEISFPQKEMKKGSPSQISHGTQARMVGELMRRDEWISLCFEPSSLCHCFPSFISSPFLSSSQSRLRREIFSIHFSKKISSVVSFPSLCAGDVFLKGEVPRKKADLLFFFPTLLHLFFEFYVTPSAAVWQCCKKSCLHCSFIVKHQRSLICQFRGLFCVNSS